MKSILIAALALACVLGLASANYYGYGGVGNSGGLGDGGLLWLIGFLFIIFFLFNGNNKSQSTTLAIINGTG